MRTRVLHFIGQIGVGGCEKQLLGLSRRIDRSKFEFGVCYYAPNPDNMVEEFESAGVRLFYENKFGGISTWRFFRRLRSFVRAFRPDIIHTWQYSANMWGRLVGLSCGYRSFICSERSVRNYPLPLHLLERVLRSRTSWTANTTAVAESLISGVRVRQDRILVIHNAVEVPKLHREQCRTEVRDELGLEPDTPIILTVGRQTRAKNYPMFYRAAHRVLQRLPQAVFISAGHGELEVQLRDLHRKMNLGASVRMLGLRMDVPRLMAAADVFCLCSNWEGFPNVLVESMASGVPAITTDFAGVTDVITSGHERFARLVGMDRDDDMAEQILALLDNRSVGRQEGEAASAFVARQFGWERLVDRMEWLYMNAAEGRLAVSMQGAAG